MKKIGIVIYSYTFGYANYPINVALALEHEGYEVHVFLDTATYERGKITFEGKHITIHPIDVPRDNQSELALPNEWQTFPRAWIASGVQRVLKLPQSPIRDVCVRSITFFQRLFFERGNDTEKLRKQTATFMPDLFEFNEKLAPVIVEDDYTCLLGFGQNGLVAATMVALKCSPMRRPPVIYFSMELLPPTTAYSPSLSAVKSLERICSQLCYFVVIQDEARGRRFIEATGVPKEKLVYVPISGLRKAYRGRDNYFRELFDIKPEKKILLHAGVFLREMMCLEIAQAALNWGDDLVLILHSPVSAPVSEGGRDYLEKLKRTADSDKVYLSLNPVEWQQVPQMISSADIGLLFYDSNAPTFHEIGRSSNKLVQYLQAGLPLIASDLPSLKRVMQDCRCGETTNHPNGIEGAARKILSDYAAYRDRAFDCYEKEYHMSRYLGSVLEKISQIE
ncbi:MAG: hypothetical protein WCI87_09040 [Euryarchaeota archaeon]